MKNKLTVGVIVILFLLFAVGSSVLTYQLVNRQNATSSFLAERVALTNERNKIIQEGINQNCKRINIKFGRLIPLEEAQIPLIKPGPHQIPYYKNNPSQIAPALKQVAAAIKIFSPDPCNVKLVGKKPAILPSSVKSQK